MNNDFKNFTNDSTPSSSPIALSTLMRSLKAQTPKVSHILLKLLLSHFLGTLITLSFCSQLGLGFVVTPHDLMHFFFHISPALCDLLCGGTYLFIIFMCTRFLISPNEWAYLKHSWGLAALGVSLVTLGGLLAFSHSPNEWAELIGASLWILGALLGAGFAFINPQRIRMRLITLFLARSENGQSS